MADQRQTSQPRRRIGPSRKGRPASLLQAARLERGWTQPEVVELVRRECPGHGGREGCLLQKERLSEWETGQRPPSLPHVQALCRTYRMSAEDLGLINWRTAEEQQRQAEGAPAWLRARIRDEFRDEFRREVTEEILAAVSGCLRGLASGDHPTA